MSDIPVVVTQAGAQPTPPAELFAKLILNVAKKVPGYTANLPPGLITDLASTATGAIALLDSAMVESINAVTPYGVNVPLLLQLGNQYGTPQGKGSYTSVNVIFMGSPGFVVPKGFVVSDGNHQYALQNNTIIPSSGQSEPAYCLATNAGTWAVPAGSVTQTITSVPSSQEITCTNLNMGLPGQSAQSDWDYRSQVMQAGMATAQGVPEFLRTLLQKVSGVQERLISYRQINTQQWAVIVGGGDPYEVAFAIYQAIPDISVLTNDVGGDNPPEGVTITINQYPDTYELPFITPTSQTAGVILTWDTTASNFVDPATVSVAAVNPIVKYLNSIPVGQPVNVYEINTIFQASVASLMRPAQISLIDVQVVINGAIVEPEDNTDLVYGDSYSYFTSDSGDVTVQRYGTS